MVFCFKQKTAYEIYQCDWSSDVCSSDLIAEISKVIPIKIKSSHIKIIIPSIYTGRAYGLIKKYEEKENWLSDGSLEIIARIPSGILLDFYERLNSFTHGSAITEELKDKE